MDRRWQLMSTTGTCLHKYTAEGKAFPDDSAAVYCLIFHVLEWSKRFMLMLTLYHYEMSFRDLNDAKLSCLGKSAFLHPSTSFNPLSHRSCDPVRVKNAFITARKLLCIVSPSGELGRQVTPTTIGRGIMWEMSETQRRSDWETRIPEGSFHPDPYRIQLPPTSLPTAW